MIDNAAPEPVPCHDRVTASVKIPLLTPLLEMRMATYGIELPKFHPVFDRCLVYPVDKADQPQATSGGIVLAEQTKQRLGAQRGVLIMAGPRAYEQLYSHGISIGDIVISARLSPWERQYFSDTHRPHRVLVMRAGDIVGSEDFKTALDRGDLRLLMDVANGAVTVDGRERSDPEDDIEGT